MIPLSFDLQVVQFFSPVLAASSKLHTKHLPLLFVNQNTQEVKTCFLKLIWTKQNNVQIFDIIILPLTDGQADMKHDKGETLN